MIHFEIDKFVGRTCSLEGRSIKCIFFKFYCPGSLLAFRFLLFKYISLVITFDATK